MGHYDDCYASDDFHEMTSEEKEDIILVSKRHYLKRGAYGDLGRCLWMDSS